MEARRQYVPLPTSRILPGISGNAALVMEQQDPPLLEGMLRHSG